jgi:protein O-mannosyl-transferase
MPTNPASLPASRKHVLIAALVLILFSLALYNPVSRHPFLNYDDGRYLDDNAHVKNGLSWASAAWAFTSLEESNWHPITWLSHMLDCQIFHMNPAGHHYANAAWHAINVALLFWVLYSATGFFWRSFVVACLFAVHPINVESVAWIAERKNLLSLFFFLLTLAAYQWYAHRPRVSRYLAVALLFTLGLMSKPQVITLPVVLLLWDYWPLQRVLREPEESCQQNEQSIPRKSWRWLFAEKLPLLALCVPSAVLTLRAQTAAGAVTSFHRYPLPIRAANAVVSYAKYLGKALWPSNLAVMYPYQPATLTKLQISLSACLLIVITGGVFLARKRYLIVGWLWFLGTLVPMIGLVQVGVQAMADRYAYLPFIGLFIAVCWGVADLAQDSSISRNWLAAPAAVTVFAFALLSHHQLGYWSSNLELWKHTAAVTSNNYVAEDGIGNSLLEQGELEQAMPHFQAAALIHPADPLSASNLAFYKMNHGDLAGALAEYKKVTEMTVDERSRAMAFFNMGFIYQQLRNFSAARDSFQSGLRIRPRNVRGWVGLGAASQRAGDLDGAMRAYSQAVALQPSDATYLFLAGALKQSGKESEAESASQTARRLSQNFPETQQFVDSIVGN